MPFNKIVGWYVSVSLLEITILVWSLQKFPLEQVFQKINSTFSK